MFGSYDIIVVGAGHAGCEAACASAKLGASVLLITMDMTKIAQMSCNPAMGGIAKGQMVREIDAMGGWSGIVTDRATIQFRMLNRSKGPAVWSPRAQCDRMLFSMEWRKVLENQSNLDIWQDSVTGLIFEKDRVAGVKTVMNARFSSKAVILTVGTFQNGLIHIGSTNFSGGRLAEKRSTGLTEQLKDLGIVSGRLKTGTPARIDGRTIRFDALVEQKGDERISGFSFLPVEKPEKQLSCYIAYTNTLVHETLHEGFSESPLYTGVIQGRGPRYCPSIEDKIVTFGEKTEHQLFLEPEGWQTNEYYLNGFSSSLPAEVQLKALRLIEGFANVKIFRPGYAIEYDYYDPRQLYHTLEVRNLENLYFAGQINGTTGYEEAAAQGLVAGINAALKLAGKDKVVFKRDESYIGVLVDDLVTKGVDEPYRMFTSRAEYRVLLRQDNADERLTPVAIDIGMASNERIKVFGIKERCRKTINEFLNQRRVIPEEINNYLVRIGSAPIRQQMPLRDLLARPSVLLSDLLALNFFERDNDGLAHSAWEELIEAIEVDWKYRGYIARDRLLADKRNRLEELLIDGRIDFDKLLSLSTEARQKLKRYRPETIGQASRISGISPSDIQVLLLYLKR